MSKRFTTGELFASTGAAALLFCGLGLASAAEAAPALAPATDGGAGGLVTTVSGGCGPGGHRGPFGGCRPNFGGGYGYGRGYGPRRCFVRPTPFGPRRVCR